MATQREKAPNDDQNNGHRLDAGLTPISRRVHDALSEGYKEAYTGRDYLGVRNAVRRLKETFIGEGVSPQGIADRVKRVINSALVNGMKAARDEKRKKQ